MIIRMTVKNIDRLYADEEARVRALNLARIGNRSNNNGQLKKCALVRYLLCALDGDTVLSVENCRGDEDIREFALTNAGSVVECIVKAVLDKGRNTEYAKAWKDDDADAMNGCVVWEVKFSGDSHYKATPAQGNRATLLINRDGVSLIRKNEVASATDSKGRLPARGLFGNRENPMVLWLAEMLGLTDGIDD